MVVSSKNKRYLVVGLARSGQAAVKLLRRHGYDVVGYDDGQVELGVEFADLSVYDAQSDQRFLEQIDCVVKSPGVPEQIDLLQLAKRRQIDVIGEFELASRFLTQPIIAVTGTNGKTTVTAAIGHILKSAGLRVEVVGNIGQPISEVRADDTEVIVAETSSFQLEDCLTFAPHIALLTNFTEDHLDRHGTLKNYWDAKRQIFHNQTEEDFAIVPADLAMQLAAFGLTADLPGQAQHKTFAGEGGDIFSAKGTLWWGETELIAVKDILLPGVHNQKNLMAGALAALLFGVDLQQVVHGLKTFSGVPHRLETVAKKNDVLYVNDSKATNVAATLVALAAFSEPIHLILGGVGKEQDFGPLKDPICRKCQAVYLIGEAAGELESLLHWQHGPNVYMAQTLQAAVQLAQKQAQAGEVVLLAPACASFDQFINFEERGNFYKEFVGA